MGRPPRPSGWGYLGAALVVVAGVAAVALCFVLGLGAARDRVDSSSVVAVGSAGVIDAATEGGYTISYFGTIKARDKEDRARLIDELKVEVRPEGGGPILPLEPYDVYNDMTVDGRNGQVVALLTFHAPEPGSYVVESSAIPEAADSGLLVGKSIYRPLRDWVLVGLGLLAVSVVVATTWAILLFVDRRRAQRGPGTGVAPVLSPVPPLGTGPLPSGIWHGPHGPVIVPPPPPGEPASVPPPPGEPVRKTG